MDNRISFLGLLTLIFITLKLCGVIDWHWVWVLSPLWIPMGGIFAFLVIGSIVVYFMEAKKQRAFRKKMRDLGYGGDWK